MKITLICLFSALLITQLPVAAQVPSGCALQKDKDGILVYTCHNDSSRFKTILSLFDLRTSFTELRQALLAVDRYPEWQFNTSATTLLRTLGPAELTYHSHIDAPWPVSDRDMAVHLTLTEEGNVMKVTANSERGLLPDTPDCIRVPASVSSWTVTRDGSVLHVAYSLVIDPGGMVPAWLVNMACAQGPYESFSKLKMKLEGKR